MDPDAVDELSASGEPSTGEANGEDAEEGGTSQGRIPHGGVRDPWVLDFSANINPVTPDGVAQVYESTLPAARSYPSDDYCSFRATAAEYVGAEATEIVPTAGGIEAIRLTVATTVAAGDEVLLPYPSFGEYAREVRLQGATPTLVRHRKLLDTDPEDFELVVVCRPNNPTGYACDVGTLQEFAERCRAAGTTLLVDEAFIGFTDRESMASTPGVVVVRSLTKLFGLPGLRAGFAVATGRCRDRLDTARPTWGLGAPAVTVGEYCMQTDGFVDDTRERVKSERRRMAGRLDSRFDVPPSEGPFLLLEARSEDVETVIETVRKEGIVVRDARTFRGLDNHVRVAVRLPAENDRLLDALDV